eukprot:TRINITY_DN752_c0_g2_i1.p1 TRINITY_DN752_c0_g2~~TRINITY_DN752_c0_g2_i1.p1  ORF type:complete len:1098 (+),score=127.79 TRINITY_DN752_c0_g2_i1:4952-8245(+)
MDSGVGSICCNALENTVTFPTENLSFALDAVFDQEVKQEDVYAAAGKAAVEDVLNGYNGTIFAYGQTGSGKTYTMFGHNIYAEESKGIIPRAAIDIFKVWEATPDIKEVEIRCSMLEIYKENLKDLLNDEFVELKIKESPSRGVYVEGLYEIPIACEEELMYYLEIGGARRSWAETRHNLVSSRSHTIFILEVRQTLNNDSEKRGILNLVDLAGSEKVGKSGAQGQLFEEGTKINLSLSALGNVIHALSSNFDYVPYRDSKLTRLLQESLGGNYKTTLIVTCSPHSSQMQETMSTLKFAQRAKKLKNKVQMNIKNSPDQLWKIIDQLKQELRAKNCEIQKMRALGKPCKIRQSITSYPGRRPSLKDVLNDSIDSQVSQVTSRLCKILAAPEVTETTHKRSGSVGSRTKGELLERIVKESKSGCEMELLETKCKELNQENEKLKTRLKETSIHLDILKKEKVELEGKVLTYEVSLVEERKKVVSLEKQLADLEEFINMHNLLKDKSTLHDQYENTKNKVLESQLTALNEALEDSETECFKLLKEKKERLEKETVEMCNLSLPDFVSKDVLHTSFTDKWVRDLNSVDLGLAGSFIGPKKLFSNKTSLKLDAKQLLSACKYAETIGTAVVDGYVSPETLNYLLRNQAIDAAIMNHNLKRVISLLVWKLQVERANGNIKGEMCKVLQKTVDSLEDLLKKSNTKHQAWKKRVEKLDYEIDLLKQELEHKKNYPSFALVKTRIRKPICSMMRQGTFKHIQLFSPQRKTSCQTLGLSRLAQEKYKASQVTEDNGEPEFLEMNEEEELKLQEIIDDRYKTGGRKVLERRNNNNNLLHVDTAGALRPPLQKNMTTVCASFKLGQMEQLEANFQELQIELAWHKTLTDLLMTELIKTREQASTLRNEIEEIKASSEQTIQDENRNWQMITNSLKVRLFGSQTNKRKIMIKNQQESRRIQSQCMNYWHNGQQNIWTWRNLRARQEIKTLLKHCSKSKFLITKHNQQDNDPKFSVFFNSHTQNHRQVNFLLFLCYYYQKFRYALYLFYYLWATNALLIEIIVMMRKVLFKSNAAFSQKVPEIRVESVDLEEFCAILRQSFSQYLLDFFV